MLIISLVQSRKMKMFGYLSSIFPDSVPSAFYWRLMRLQEITTHIFQQNKDSKHRTKRTQEEQPWEGPGVEQPEPWSNIFGRMWKCSRITWQCWRGSAGVKISYNPSFEVFSDCRYRADSIQNSHPELVKSLLVCWWPSGFGSSQVFIWTKRSTQKFLDWLFQRSLVLEVSRSSSQSPTEKTLWSMSSAHNWSKNSNVLVNKCELQATGGNFSITAKACKANDY